MPSVQRSTFTCESGGEGCLKGMQISIYSTAWNDSRVLDHCVIVYHSAPTRPGNSALDGHQPMLS